MVTTAMAVACGGKLVDAVDASSRDNDASEDAFEAGSDAAVWCDPQAGPLQEPTDAAVICGFSTLVDAQTYCEFALFSNQGESWSCCTKDDWTCCPAAVNMLSHGVSTLCCSQSDCSACCNGINPGSYFADH
jgi:hypothetical protein